MLLNSLHGGWPVGENIHHQQPDVTICIGNTQQSVKFVAHKRILSTYSGYFRTLFSSHDGAETSISDISSHAFAHLLAFMYSGHLELNPLNAYELFLASGLLNMVEALHRCKQYLMQKHNYAQQAASVAVKHRSPSVVKPIPRRNTAAGQLHEAEQQHRILNYRPLRLHNELSSVFKPVRPETARRCKSNSGHDEDVEEVANERYENYRVAKQRSIVEEGSEVLFTSPPNDVVLDVACCDGPIKFHRVTNQHYDPRKAIIAANKEIASEGSGGPCLGCGRNFQNDVDSNEPPGCVERNATDRNAVDRSRLTATASLAVKCKRKAEILQFYPCKICGSKFPSYYFVHKHRKLHHRDTKEFND